MIKVLIVDDAMFVRYTLKAILERNGFEVVGEAENGALGVKKYFECKPDIVTMDITMPEMDGITALKAIIKENPKAKIIMVSAMGQEAFVKEAVLNGARYFIAKPFEEERVVETLKKIAAI